MSYATGPPGPRGIKLQHHDVSGFRGLQLDKAFFAEHLNHAEHSTIERRRPVHIGDRESNVGEPVSWDHSPSLPSKDAVRSRPVQRGEYHALPILRYRGRVCLGLAFISWILLV